MPDATFTDVFDWLVDRRGQRVFIEVGRTDPQAEQRADFVVLGLYTTLGEVQTVEDTVHARRALKVVLGLGDDHEGGIELDEVRVQQAKIHGGGLKVWQEDIYIGVAAGEVAVAPARGA
jgi:hypothetical protein